MSELTYAQVKEHKTKDDLYLVIADKVYNASSFIDEHPGGEEVLLDVAGDDATEAFEDVGHSDEAREILNGLKIGDLKRQPGDPQPKSTGANAKSAGAGNEMGVGVGLYVLLVIGALLAYAAYYYMAQ